MKVNYAYLEQKVGITNFKDFKERILSHWETLNIQGQIRSFYNNLPKIYGFQLSY